MQKISRSDVYSVLHEASSALRDAKDQLQELKQKVAAYEAADRAEVLIEKMEARGHFLEGDTTREKVANLLASGRDLNVLEAAVDLSVPNGSSFSVGDDPGAGHAASALEQAILG